LAESLVKVNSGHIITTILNTRKQEVELPNPVVKVIKLRDRDVGETVWMGMAVHEKGRDGLGQNRGKRVIAKLRTEHLYSEEKKSLHELCFDYQDVFFSPGDKLSCTNVARHAIQLETGVREETERDGTRAETRFGFPANGRVHLYRQGCQFSRLLAAEVCGSAVVMLDRPNTNKIIFVVAVSVSAFVGIFNNIYVNIYC